MSERSALLQRGRDHITAWCEANFVVTPKIVERIDNPRFSACGYYRAGVINIFEKRCARVGRAGRQWSYPGYTVDRTPYGVLAHELGHHVDDASGRRGGTHCHVVVHLTHEEPISGYCPTVHEWFAEMFKVFVTNPDLLRVLRPKTYDQLTQRWPHPIEVRRWDEVLASSERHINAVRNKLKRIA